jgi:hypothetical protein
MSKNKQRHNFAEIHDLRLIRNHKSEIEYANKTRHTVVSNLKKNCISLNHVNKPWLYISATLLPTSA